LPDVVFRLYITLLNDQLNEYSYDANVAGLGYSLDDVADGLVLAVNGYNDKLDVLLARIAHRMRHLVIKKERFDVQKDALARQLRNWRLNEPSEHAIYYTSYLLTARYWTNEELEKALEGIRICSDVGG
jgi:insulysin